MENPRATIRGDRFEPRQMEFGGQHIVEIRRDDLNEATFNLPHPHAILDEIVLPDHPIHFEMLSVESAYMRIGDTLVYMGVTDVPWWKFWDRPKFFVNAFRDS